MDRDVVHPHGILFRRRRGVRQAHGIAVVFDLALSGAASPCSRRGCRLIIVEAEIGGGRHRAVVAAIRRLSRHKRVRRLAVRILVVDRGAALLGRSRADYRGGARRRPVWTGDGECDPGRRDQRGGQACCDGAGHFCAVMTSLFSTVPVSPWTLAPSESCHRPAMPKVALKRYVPGSVPGMAVTLVAISCMPSGAMSKRLAKITASGTGLPVLVFTSRTVTTLSGPAWTDCSTSSNV